MGANVAGEDKRVGGEIRGFEETVVFGVGNLKKHVVVNYFNWETIVMGTAVYCDSSTTSKISCQVSR